MSALLNQAGFTAIRTQEKRKILYFKTRSQVLRHLQRSGVNALDRRTWTPGMLRQLYQEYQRRFQGPQGLPPDLPLPLAGGASLQCPMSG